MARIGRPPKPKGTHVEFQRVGIHVPLYKKIKGEAKRKNITINEELRSKYKVKA